LLPVAKESRWRAESAREKEKKEKEWVFIVVYRKLLVTPMSA
jgi:hypothetical protein